MERKEFEKAYNAYVLDSHTYFGRFYENGR
jgi:hypothetical protein